MTTTTQRGMCSVAADAKHNLTIDDRWTAALTQLGVPRVRVSLGADDQNDQQLALYTRGLAPYQRAGIGVSGILDADFNRPWLAPTPRDLYPNDLLGYQGNQRWNRWIKDSIVRAAHLATELGDLVDTYLVGNEPNLRAVLPIGANVPPDPTSLFSMAPEVYGSYAYETAHWVKAAMPHVRVLYGPLSWLAGSGNDLHNPYCALYLERSLAYLAKTGVRDWPFDGIALNGEGQWTPVETAAVASTIAQVTAPYARTPVPIIFSEWSWQNGNGVDPAVAATNWTALTSISKELYFFSDGVASPNDLKGYGGRLYMVEGTLIVPANQTTSWWPILESEFQTA